LQDRSLKQCPSPEPKPLGQQLWRETIVPETPEGGGSLTSLQKASSPIQELNHVLGQAAKRCEGTRQKGHLPEASTTRASAPHHFFIFFFYLNFYAK
jgi:hypothetical protein